MDPGRICCVDANWMWRGKLKMWNFLTSTRRQAPLSSLSPTLDEMEQRLSAEFAVILIELEKENELLFSVNRKVISADFWQISS